MSFRSFFPGLLCAGVFSGMAVPFPESHAQSASGGACRTAAEELARAYRRETGLTAPIRSYIEDVGKTRGARLLVSETPKAGESSNLVGLVRKLKSPSDTALLREPGAVAANLAKNVTDTVKQNPLRSAAQVLSAPPRLIYNWPGEALSRSVHFATGYRLGLPVQFATDITVSALGYHATLDWANRKWEELRDYRKAKIWDDKTKANAAQLDALLTYDPRFKLLAAVAAKKYVEFLDQCDRRKARAARAKGKFKSKAAALKDAGTWCAQQEIQQSVFQRSLTQIHLDRLTLYYDCDEYFRFIKLGDDKPSGAPAKECQTDDAEEAWEYLNLNLREWAKDGYRPGAANRPRAEFTPELSAAQIRDLARMQSDELTAHQLVREAVYAPERLANEIRDSQRKMLNLFIASPYGQCVQKLADDKILSRGEVLALLGTDVGDFYAFEHARILKVDLTLKTDENANGGVYDSGKLENRNNQRSWALRSTLGNHPRPADQRAIAACIEARAP